MIDLFKSVSKTPNFTTYKPVNIVSQLQNNIN